MNIQNFKSFFYEGSVDILKANISNDKCTLFWKNFVQHLRSMIVDFIVNEKESYKCIECLAEVAHSDK